MDLTLEQKSLLRLVLLTALAAGLSLIGSHVWYVLGWLSQRFDAVLALVK